MSVEGSSIELGPDHRMLLSEPEQSLPVYATLDGVAVAIIAATEYKELLALRMRLPTSSLVNLRRKVRAGWEPRPLKNGWEWLKGRVEATRG